MDIMTIGIAGGTGSGKTTITERLRHEFGKNVSVIYHDSYYKAHDELTYEERTRLNYDHPDAFDTELLVEHLKALRRGESILCPIYDYTAYNRSKEFELIKPASVIIVEGLLILQNAALCAEMDIKLFVDADADERILRRITRDVHERGRSLDSVIRQYLETVKPMHEQFIEPSRRNADIIIPQGGYNLVAMDIITERIRSHVNKEN